MKTPHPMVTALLAVSLAWAAPVVGQTGNPASPAAEQSAQAPVFSSQQLDSLLAPIALYPDTLLSQVLMAATYPLEVVQASRWSKANGDKGGEAAVNQAASQPWDPSVQSLVGFPNVLNMMSDQLDWTQNLGDAFLAQERDVIDSIQRLRRQAQQAGNLKSSPQQNVVTQGQTIVIEPAQPSVIYVPAYNPTVVYGAWPYPSYPPAYYPGVMSWYPGQALVSGLAWGTGFAMAGAMYGGFNWGRGEVNVNVNNYNRYSRNSNNVYRGGDNTWRHDPQHRGSVGYRDQNSQRQYAGANNRAAGAEARRDYRGHDAAQSRSAVAGGADRSVQRQGVADRTGAAGQRAGVGDGAQRPGAGDGVQRPAGVGGQRPGSGEGQQRSAGGDLSGQRQAVSDRAGAAAGGQRPGGDGVQRPAAGAQRPAGGAAAAQRPAGGAQHDAFKGVDSGRQQIDRGRASSAAAAHTGGKAAGSGGARSGGGGAGARAGGGGGGGGGGGRGGRGR